MKKNSIYISIIAILTILLLAILGESKNDLSLIISLVSIILIIILNFIKYEDKIESQTQIIEEKENNQEMIDEILNISKHTANGDYSLQIEQISDNQTLNEIATNINTTLSNFKKTIDSVIFFMDKYNKNDFTISIENSYNNDLKKMIDHINQVNIKISKMLLNSLKNNTKLSSNSDKLKENMDLLGKSVIEQSATLEETAASIEEITQTITENNINVQNMLKYSGELSTSIDKGFENAKNNASLMENINEKTKSIEEAIVVIDQIAFQTNILSLNAAVEAATAGEAGKGFAVVAQEVRNLASRSAQAAKEIKSLVLDATEVTQEGKESSSEMIYEYDKINENIDRTKNIIDDISTSLSEQQRGIQQINDAVSQLDKKTQENALMAQNTLDVVNTNNNMTKQMVVETNKTNFFGRDEFNKNQ